MYTVYTLLLHCDLARACFRCGCRVTVVSVVRVGCLAVGEGCGHARTRAWVLRSRGRNDQNIHRILSQVPSEGALGNLGDGKYIIATLRRQLIRLCVPSRIGQNRNTTCLQPPWHFGDHSTLNSQTTYLHRSQKQTRMYVPKFFFQESFVNECRTTGSAFTRRSKFSTSSFECHRHYSRIYRPPPTA